MQAVVIFETTYQKPTDHTGAKISVKPLHADGGRGYSVPFDHELNTYQNHYAAAVSKMPADMKPVGFCPSKNGYLFTAVKIEVRN